MDHQRLAFALQLQYAFEPQQRITKVSLHRLDGGDEPGGLQRCAEAQAEAGDIGMTVGDCGLGTDGGRGRGYRA